MRGTDFSQGSKVDEFPRSDHIGQRVEDEPLVETVNVHPPLEPLEPLRVLLLANTFVHLDAQLLRLAERFFQQLAVRVVVVGAL